MVLAVAVLGPPLVTVDDAPLDVDTRKAVAVLALLAVDGPHVRSQLAAVLWPHADRGHARNALRRTLSVLNRALGPYAWAAGDDRLALPADARTDVGEHRALLAGTHGHGHPVAHPCGDCIAPLTAAAALHRGPLLEGFRLRGDDGDGFEEWVGVAGERLRRDHVTVLERLSRAEIEHDLLDAATEHVATWVRRDPLVEEAWARLALLHAWAGRHDEAERTLSTCSRVLRRELGVPPGPATARLLRQVVDRTVPPVDAVDVPVPPTP